MKQTLYLPDLLYSGIAREGTGLLVNEDGNVAALATPESVPGAEVVRLTGKALFPGLANAHSHAFQRLFRARAEGRTALGKAAGADTFWTWREQMYRAAAFVSSEAMYDVARAVYLEMLASGITVVGEFHYLHNAPDGTSYADPNELALTLIRAAQSVGIRIVLLRSAYLRAGFNLPPHFGQRRFYETEDAYLRNLDALLSAAANQPKVTVGAAPHSIRAVPLDTLKRIYAFAREQNLPVHIHLSEQIAENEACIAEYGLTPPTLLAENGILHHTTLIHAIHMTEAEFEQTGRAGAHICSCPTTERNLGDGIFPADRAARLGIPVCHGTDSQAQIDILEDVRQTEYHLRLLHRERGILDFNGNIGSYLLHCATARGYSALGLNGGSLHPTLGQPADFFTADLNDLALLGADKQSLATQAAFALSRSAIRDVAVAGKLVLVDGHHPQEEAIRTRYQSVQRQFAQEAP
ncbi:formimidoylglutamate deiminase [Terracidiphilus sp.]|jgi:formimidoylglutamate deiminase|uniref:formimidoylglutamate deiminase n=1 Tax=Terracidiphilus sp. TaxID=1964191 RepID=UPI003C1C0ED7